MAMDEKIIIAAWEDTHSIRKCALAANVAVKTALKVLVSNGILPTRRSEEIAHMAQTMTVEQIAKALKTTPKNVANYLPYTRGTYLTDHKTENALRIAESRKKKADKANDD